MSLPVIESYESNSSGVSSSYALNCNKPSGVEIGDLLVLICANDSIYFNEFQVTAGWTRIGQNATNMDCCVATYYRIADGTEGVSQSVQANNRRFWCMFYIRISGVNQDDPINAVSAFAVQRNSSNFAIPQLTTDKDNCLIIYGNSFDGGDGYPFGIAGNGYVEKDETLSHVSTSGSSACWGSSFLTAAGITDPAARIYCSTADGTAYFQFAVNSPDGTLPLPIEFFKHIRTNHTNLRR